MSRGYSMLGVALAMAALSATGGTPTGRRRKDPEPQKLSGTKPIQMIIDYIEPSPSAEKRFNKGLQLKRPVQSSSLKRMLRKARR